MSSTGCCRTQLNLELRTQVSDISKSASSLYTIINKQYHFVTSSDRFPLPVRSAVKSNFTNLCCQNLSKPHTHTHPFNGTSSGTTRVSRYQKGNTNLDLCEARDSEWQWHPLGHMQVCTSLQTDNHASTPLLSFLQTGCPSCRPTNRP